ncbi:MAG: anthranilate synthase component I [Fimbriimonas ginsengisoli]|uniref:Anthranilate synthase component 1 n=1 Tax=Fimbriimonas ginsengisoli TaxID=1005039 RepID=A0A931PU20_FIMGI|nr:anthranilate synthase component I [Fimbriimonas ginsengisoli]
MPSPDLSGFLKLAAPGRRVPVWQDLLADVETPLRAYWKLAHDTPASFLLESVTGGEALARYSILGLPTGVVRPAGGDDPLAVARAILEGLRADPTAGLPKFIGGIVGMLGYDLVRHLERLPNAPPDDLGLPTAAFMVVDQVVVFDHARNRLRIIALAEPNEPGYRQACETVANIVRRLQSSMPTLPAGVFPVHPVQANQERATFESSVRRIREYIGAGDAYQVVPSIRFSTQVDAHPVTVYRALRSLNPSPYMFLLRFGDFDLVGASPELLVSLNGETARVRPIAGTRPRGSDEAEDARLAAELLADEKERAEHTMLVDLGRNDLGRVSEYGSVKVNELMVIERYSHVMHIVSDVTGRLRPGLDGFDLVRGAFPAGTVSGAPKVRAMQIIDELEPTRRGPYAGAVGYFGATGDLDLAITIRTILIKDGKAYVQAGAGIVHDSVPEREYDECVNKARGSLAAIEMAQVGLGGPLP